MAVFKAGPHDWRIDIKLGTVARLRTDAAFDLSKAAAGGELATALFTDPDRLGEILWVLVRDEATARGLDQVGFFELLGGPELEAAAAAVMEAVVDFFHRGRASEIKAKLPGLTATLNAKIGAAAVAAIDSISSGSGGNSPASSGSTPPA